MVGTVARDEACLVGPIEEEGEVQLEEGAELGEELKVEHVPLKYFPDLVQ